MINATLAVNHSNSPASIGRTRLLDLFYAPFVALLAVLIPLEVLCAYLAYETIGDITSLLYFGAIGLNLGLILMAWRYRTLATLGIVLLALVIIPYQLVLGQRLWRVQSEAARIVTYVYEERLHTGEYPPDLTNYIFHDPEVAQYIQQYERAEARGGFFVAYRVGTDSTSHWYSPLTGWGYYPD